MRGKTWRVALAMALAPAMAWCGPDVTFSAGGATRGTLSVAREGPRSAAQEPYPQIRGSSRWNRAQGQGRLEGVVRLDGRPVAGAKVSAEMLGSAKPKWIPAYPTDAAGEYTIEGVPTGDYNVHATLPDSAAEIGRPRMVRPVSIRGPEAKRIDFGFVPADSEVRGTVTINGAPAHRARVTAVVKTDVSEEELVTHAIEDGSYRVHPIPPGRVELTVSKGGYKETATVRVGSRRVARRDVAFTGQDPRIDLGNALAEAAGAGDLQAVEELLAEGANPDGFAADGKPRRPLVAGVDGGSQVILEVLLKAGADPNLANPIQPGGKGGHSPLVQAVLKGRAPLVRTLLGKGAKANHPDGQRRYPLSVAAGAGSVELTNILLAAGADPKWGAPLVAAAEGNHLDLIELLAAKGADPNAMAYRGVTPLLAAAQANHVAAIRALLALGADPNPAYGRCPLATAVAVGHGQAVRALLAGGADPAVAKWGKQAPSLADAPLRNAWGIVIPLMLYGYGPLWLEFFWVAAFLAVVVPVPLYRMRALWRRYGKRRAADGTTYFEFRAWGSAPVVARRVQAIDGARPLRERVRGDGPRGETAGIVRSGVAEFHRQWRWPYGTYLLWIAHLRLCGLALLCTGHGVLEKHLDDSVSTTIAIGALIGLLEAAIFVVLLTRKPTWIQGLTSFIVGGLTLAAVLAVAALWFLFSQIQM